MRVAAERSCLHGARALVLCGFVVSCAPPEQGPSEIAVGRQSPGHGEQPEEAFAALDRCPADDLIWADAFNDADQQGRLDVLREHADELIDRCPELWQPLWLSGICGFYLDDYAGAAEALTRAIDLARQTNNSAGIALSAHELGWIEYQQGRVTEALTLFEEGIQAASEVDRPDVQAQCTSARGAGLLQVGRFREAHESFENAIPLYESIGAAQHARWVRYNDSVLLMVLGDLNSARDRLEQLYSQSVESGDTDLTALSAVALGAVNFERRTYREAEQWFARVPADDAQQAAQAELYLARIAARRGDVAEAKRRLLPVTEQDRDRILALLAMAYLGKVELQQNHLTESRRVLMEVIAEADRLAAAEPAWIARVIMGRTWLREARYYEAIRRFSQAIELIEEHGQDLDPLEEGLRFLRERLDAYVDLAVALALNPAGDASIAEDILQVVERAHARALRRALREGETVLTSVSLDDLRSSLGERDLLLNYLIGEERGVVLAVRRNTSLAVQIPGSLELAGPLRQYRTALMRPLRSADARRAPMADLARSLDAGQQLRAMLLDPVKSLFEDVERIYVVPDQNVAILPFQALPWGEDEPGHGRPVRFLGEFSEVVVLPLTGMLPRWQDESLPMLLAGDPLADPDGQFPVLPAAELEMDLISKEWRTGDTSRLQRASLTPANFLGQPLQDFRTIHLATHAVASTADPQGCAVYMSNGERLGLEQIVELKLDASPLVVLSACRTGEGELIPGEGVVGLTWAFLRAGAKGVVASLWSVEDTATTELMVAFHRHMREGKDPVAALAAAQREIAEQYFHPAYWAPFVLVARPELPS